jgi:hypothetical protein
MTPGAYSSANTSGRSNYVNNKRKKRIEERWNSIIR